MANTIIVPTRNPLESVVVFVVLVLSAVGIWYFGFRKPPTTTPPPKQADPTQTQTPPQYPTNTGTNTSTNTSANTSELDENKELKLGSKGLEVKALQVLCNKLATQKGVAKLTADGDFGKKTQAFVEKYMPPYLTLKTAKAYLKSFYNIE